MKRTTMMGIAVGAILTLSLGPSARTQNAPPSKAALPSEVNLVRSRADVAALGAARQNPLAARLQGVLRQDRATADVLSRAAASSVPVLAPADPALLRTARLYTGDRFYMLTVQRGDQVIEIYGATKAFRPAPQQPAAAPARLALARARPVAALAPRVAAAARQNPTPGVSNLRAEQTEYGTDVTFARFGAAYNVSFICESQGATGCGPAEAAAFALSLQLIGGGA